MMSHTRARRFLGLKTGRAMMAGAGSISLDQRLRAPRVRSAKDAMRDDWSAVGGYLRSAMQRGV